jgi:hypothetical protein
VRNVGRELLGLTGGAERTGVVLENIGEVLDKRNCKSGDSLHI